MRKCLELAEIALSLGNPPVGALLVYQDKIISQGVEAGKSTGDVTRHAEIEVIRNAVSTGFGPYLSEATLYTTHEPCVMCAYVIRHHRIPSIVFGQSVPEVGGFSSKFNILSTTSVTGWKKVPEIISGVCEAECKILRDRFLAGVNK